MGVFYTKGEKVSILLQVMDDLIKETSSTARQSIDRLEKTKDLIRRAKSKQEVIDFIDEGIFWQKHFVDEDKLRDYINDRLPWV